MACAATLKRSLEFDPVHSPTHNSPKRRRCMPMTITPSTPPSKFNRSTSSSFSGVVEKLTTDKLAASIAQEVKRMQRRRQLHFPVFTQSVTPLFSVEKSEDLDLPSCSSPERSPQASQSLNNLFSSIPQAKKDVPLFTFNQVKLICESVVREREEEVKEQYDKVLNCKMAEQYESFLKFNHDQLHRRFGKSEMSYVS